VKRKKGILEVVPGYMLAFNLTFDTIILVHTYMYGRARRRQRGSGEKTQISQIPVSCIDHQ
jgi:hypothetical protein